MGKLLLAAVMIATTVVAGAQAKAALILDFSSAVVGGLVVATPAGVAGTNIPITTFAATGTPLNSGSYTVVNGVLDYSSGSYIGTVGPVSSYNDGHFTVTGSIPALGIGQEILVSGSLGNFIVDAVTQTLNIAAAGGPDTKAPDLLASLGIAAGTPFEAGLSDIIFLTSSTGPTNWQGLSTSVDATNDPVPEPSSIVLLLAALVPLAAWYRGTENVA